MDWNLVVSVVSAIGCLGCIGWLFTAGRWKGEVDTKLDTIRTDLNTTIESIPLDADIDKRISIAVAALRRNHDDAFTRVHERLDGWSNENAVHLAQLQAFQNRLDVLIAGLQGQRQEWDQLRSDVRSLLRTEATTGVELINAKARLAVFEDRLNEWSASLIRLQSDLNHLSNDLSKRPS